MTKKYAVYCSGTAGRVIRFYRSFSLADYPLNFILYDGEDFGTLSSLRTLSTVPVFTHDSQKPISDQLLYLSLSYGIDYIFCFGSKLLKGELLEKYKNKIINFHPSLLPAFPGKNSIDQALNSNVQILGNTAHFIDAGIDTGPIIMQSALPRVAYQNYESVLSLQIYMLKRIWQLLEEDKILIDEFDRVFIKAAVQEQNVLYSI